MQLPLYQVDAFADRLFSGNPAAVCPLASWLPEETMQLIAAENNLSETAFFVPNGEYYDLRWFTPEYEVDLCGHATLAAGYVLYEHMGYNDSCIVFETKSGRLFVERENDRYAMDFPAWVGKTYSATERVTRALGHKPDEIYFTRDLMAVFHDEAIVREMVPDMKLARELDGLGLIATAPGSGGFDFVSRFFAPDAGIPEDPVTGSAHCTLVPYWAQRLGKTTLTSYQASARGGVLYCEHQGERVRIAGNAVCYMTGSIHL